MLAGLVDRLALPAGPPFLPLAAEANGWHAGSPPWEGAGRPCPGSWSRRPWRPSCRSRATQGTQVLVHQDLHSGNVLAAERTPWLAIDPKPLAAELEFAVAPVVRDAALGHRPELVRRRLDRLVAALGLDAERARGWALVQAVAWGFDGTGPSRANLEVAAWLLADDR